MMTETIEIEDVVLRALREYSDANNPSAFLAANSGNSYFTLPGRPGFIAYRTTSRYVVQFGGPFAPREAYPELLSAFTAFAAEQGRPVVAVQLQRHDAGHYEQHGFTVNQIGASYAVDLATYSLAGHRFMKLRNKISQAARNGLTVVEGELADWEKQMRAIDEVWLPTKGENARMLEYLVGEYGGPAQRHRRLFLGLIGGELVGYISYSPVYGDNPGWMHDLCRRRPGGSPGIMESLNDHAMKTFQAEGVPWLHFGFTPFTSLRPEFERPGASPGFGWLMHFLWEHGESIYPAATQLAYKEKWGPDLVIPEYVAFQGRASITGFAHIFRAANAL
ncbi:uncharacterized protein DUF2156 [Streptomyces puniciscabiei]|uniref:Uncharacterized protein DUF2156 n=2 Tax=Streptomyces puniciscabiei TaxID=164348 RepID=A0A542UH48_9ACTN|nr:uncharacterized protein DUF2156 [Streptomyces puniciscabiei]